jgi:hypothetical protein
MEPSELSNEVVVLARSAEVRVLGSAREAEGALRAGFHPAAVLLGAGGAGPGMADFTRRLSCDPARAGVPVLAVSGDADRIRMTLVSEGEGAIPSDPEALASLLELLEELCGGPCEAC